MPLNLDSCITGIFVPGNIGASSGQTPIVRVMPQRAPTTVAAAIVETATAVDLPAFVLGILSAAIAETASAADVVAAGIPYAVAVAEAASAADTTSVVVTVTADVAEAATAADTVSGTSTWTPANLGSALRAWYKMDTLTGSNGDLQGTITDASGNSFTLTQTSTNRATLVVPGLNSLNVIRFTSATFYPMSSTILTGSSAGSLYLILRNTLDSGFNNGLMDWGSSASDSHWPFTDGVFYNDFGSTVRKTVGNPTASFVTDYRILSIYSAASDWAFYIDGGAGGSGGGTSPFFSTATNTVGWKASGINLGRNTGGAVFDGWIAEMVFTNAKQSTTDRQKTEGYLAHKWGLTGNLSSSHPYKTTPP